MCTTSSSVAQDLLGFGGAVIGGLEGVSGDEQGEFPLDATWSLHEWTKGKLRMYVCMYVSV